MYLAGQNFLDLHFYIGFLWFWPAKLFLASQNQIWASQNKFGRADGIGKNAYSALEKIPKLFLYMCVISNSI